VQLDWPVNELYLPAGQTVQAVDDADPVAATKVPTTQLEQAERPIVAA